MIDQVPMFKMILHFALVYLLYCIITKEFSANFLDKHNDQ